MRFFECNADLRTGHQIAVEDILLNDSDEEESSEIKCVIEVTSGWSL